MYHMIQLIRSSRLGMDWGMRSGHEAFYLGKLALDLLCIDTAFDF